MVSAELDSIGLDLRGFLFKKSGVEVFVDAKDEV